MGTVGHSSRKEGGYTPQDHAGGFAGRVRTLHEQHPILAPLGDVALVGTVVAGGIKTAATLDPQLPAQLGQLVGQVERALAGGSGSSALVEPKGSGVKVLETATPDPNEIYASTIQYLESFGPAYQDMHAQYMTEQRTKVVDGKDVTYTVTYVEISNATVEVDLGRYTDTLGGNSPLKEMTFSNKGNSSDASQLAFRIANGAVVNPVVVPFGQSVDITQDPLTSVNGHQYNSIEFNLPEGGQTTLLYPWSPDTAISSGPSPFAGQSALIIGDNQKPDAKAIGYSGTINRLTYHPKTGDTWGVGTYINPNTAVTYTVLNGQPKLATYNGMVLMVRG